MKPLFLCSLSLLLVLFLGCGAKFIDVNVSVTDENDKPLPAKGTLKDRTQRYTLNFSNGIAPARIAKPKEGEEIFLDISCSGYESKKDFYPVDEEKKIDIKLEPLRPRIDFMDCSPSTNRNASAIFDLPEPFGPTTDVIGVENSRSSFFAKDLNPLTSSDLRYIEDILPYLCVSFETPQEKRHLPKCISRGPGAASLLCRQTELPHLAASEPLTQNPLLLSTIMSAPDCQ